MPNLCKTRVTIKGIGVGGAPLSANRSVNLRIKASHMGGAWERLIRSVKVSLTVVLKGRSTSDEVLSTLLSEVEHMPSTLARLLMCRRIRMIANVSRRITLFSEGTQGNDDNESLRSHSLQFGSIVAAWDFRMCAHPKGPILYVQAHIWKLQHPRLRSPRGASEYTPRVLHFNAGRAIHTRVRGRERKRYARRVSAAGSSRKQFYVAGAAANHSAQRKPTLLCRTVTVFVLTLSSVNIITRIHTNSPSLRRTAAAVAVRTAAAVLKYSLRSLHVTHARQTQTSKRSVYTPPRRLITRILMTQKSATQTHAGCACYRIRERAIARRGEHTKTKTSICSVSWMRKRDMHILSVGILMYTSDLRFQVIHPEKSDNWTLQIKSPQKRDSGIYECQVSTEPKMYLNYSLNVIVFSSTTIFKLKLMINFVGIGRRLYMVHKLSPVELLRARENECTRLKVFIQALTHRIDEIENELFCVRSALSRSFFISLIDDESADGIVAFKIYTNIDHASARAFVEFSREKFVTRPSITPRQKLRPPNHESNREKVVCYSLAARLYVYASEQRHAGEVPTTCVARNQANAMARRAHTL
ncbi:unnamed protein product, partial [Trichogramma brassicae]